MLLFLVRSWLLLGICLLLVSCTPVLGPADQPLVQSSEWHMDPTGQETLHDVEKATDWQPLPEWKTWGFGPETVWVRLNLKAAAPDTQEMWSMRVRPAFLDYVTLYDPAARRVLHTGDALPPDDDGLASINFSLQIPALPYERSVYLQIRSTSARALHVEVLPNGYAQQRDRLQEWVVGFVGTTSAIFAIWALAQWWGTREKVILAFAVKQLFATAYAFFFMGFARIVIGPLLPEGVLTSMASTIFVWTVCVTIWFLSLLIEGYHPSRWALRACRLTVIQIVFLPALLWSAHPHLMLRMANTGVLLCFALLLFTLTTAIPQRVKQAIPLPVFMAYLLMYSTLNTLPIIMFMGWIEAHPIMLFGTLTHVVMDGVVMFIMLQIRASAMRHEQMQIAFDLQRSQQQAEDEKRHREEQSQLFAMLAHEMKTPLATLRMWMEAGQLKPETMERAISDMNQVIERCVHTGQLADQGLQPDWQTVDPVSLTHACIQSCRNPAQVDMQATAEKGQLQTDAQMLSIVLGNLLDNACKYSAPGGRIRVTLTSKAQDGQPGWAWQVCNASGPAGLPDATHLFEKYYRSPQARRLSGSGLGLFLVKGLLDLMQGHIAYDVQANQAVFSLWLPQDTIAT